MHWPVFLVFICLVKLTFECFNKIRNGRFTDITWTNAGSLVHFRTSVLLFWKLISRKLQDLVYESAISVFSFRAPTGQI